MIKAYPIIYSMEHSSGGLGLSIVIPVFNEEETLLPLHSQLADVLGGLGRTYEVIFVDDGSTDGSFEALKSIHGRDDSVKVIRFQRNFGKSDSLSAGFDAARGELVLTMDADLQDVPSEIPKFIRKIDEGYDIVVGWRHSRMDPQPKVLLSRFFNKLTFLLTGVNVHDSNCGFKIFRRRVLGDIHLHGELHRYIPSIAQFKGYRVGEVKIKHQKRLHGKSKYNSSRLLTGFMDLITVKTLMIHMRNPTHFFFLSGIVLMVSGLIAGLYLVYLRLMDEAIGNRPLLLLSMLLLMLGFQMFSMGFFGEMLETATNKRNYVVRERL